MQIFYIKIKFVAFIFLIFALGCSEVNHLKAMSTLWHELTIANTEIKEKLAMRKVAEYVSYNKLYFTVNVMAEDGDIKHSDNFDYEKKKIVLVSVDFGKEKSGTPIGVYEWKPINPNTMFILFNE